MMNHFKLALSVLKLHVPIVSILVTIALTILFVILFQKGVNIILVGLVYVPAGIGFVLGSSLIAFLTALLLFTFGLKENSVKLLSMLLSYPITIALGFLVMRFFR